MEQNLKYNINPLVSFIEKEASGFTKADIINFVFNNDIRIINFRYIAHDGRLKTLNFPVTNYEYLNTILSFGERVDGSSLFPYIEAGSSDLYVVPRFSTAYLDPFAEIPTLGLLCSYFTKDGVPLESSPEYTLTKAHKEFKQSTGHSFQAMGELEFYLVDSDDGMFPTPNQRGYHESTPFTKFESFRCEAMTLIAKAGGDIKYGHSEVGNFVLDGKMYEQNEIEFLVTDVEKAADQLVLGKWILRTLAYDYGIDITFAPKITTGKAGSGLHFHTKILKDGKNVMTGSDGKLSETARRAIAGYMTCASSLTAFGNANPTSYFRLVPHQEAPTSICWGDRNRSVLVRVPLGWSGTSDMVALANNSPSPALPQGEGEEMPTGADKQTVEMRSPDGSADIYLMLAGLVTAARIGLETPDALAIAEKTYVDVNIHDPKNSAKLDSLDQLPASCFESAAELEKNRALYEAKGVFSPMLIDGIISKLKSFEDANIRNEIISNPALMEELVKQFFHCG